MPREKLDLPNRLKSIISKPKNLIIPALAGTLMMNSPKAFSQGNEKTENNPEKKETIYNKASNDINEEETIQYNDAVSQIDGKEYVFGIDDVKDYIENNKEEIIQNINEISKEKINEGILENEEIQNIIQELANRSDIQQAVLRGDKEYIEKAVKDEINIKNGRDKTLNVFGCLWLGQILIGIVNKIKKKIEETY